MSRIRIFILSILFFVFSPNAQAQHLGIGQVGGGYAHGDIFRVSEGEIEILEELCTYRTSYRNPAEGYGISDHYDCPGGGSVVVFREHMVAYVFIAQSH